MRQAITYALHILANDHKIGISVITLMKLTHGIVLADTQRESNSVRSS